MRLKLLLLVWAWVLVVTSGCGATPSAPPADAAPAAPVEGPAESQAAGT